MISNCPPILADISKRFNARLNPFDFIENVQGLVDVLNQQSKNDDVHFLILPCDDIKILRQLIEFNYLHLISEIIKMLKIEVECVDVFTSIIGKELFEILSTKLESMKSKVKIKANTTEFRVEISAPEFFIDAILSPLSQFHTEIKGQLEFFNSIINLNSRNSDKRDITENLFINSNVSTPFSYFTMAYTAEHLNIKLKL